MHILFLHAAHSNMTAEYRVHATLASNAPKEMVDTHYIWQSPVTLPGPHGVKVITHDFGRDLSIRPQPSRSKRAQMMLRRLPASLAFLSAKIRHFRPDVIYTSQQTYDVFFANLLSKIHKVPHVIHLHYNVGPWLGRQTMRAIRKSSRLIAVSEYVRQNAILQGVNPAVIHTVINSTPVIHNEDQVRAERESVRAEFGIAADAPLILAVGRLDPSKGHSALFEAFAQLLTQQPHARLLLCGTSTTRDSYESHLRLLADELRIASSTVFAGQRNNIPEIMRSADVFCLPTELDPCPLVFLEAMATGLPVAAYYSGGVPELVVHTQTGLLAYPGDTQALASHLQRLLVDTSYAQRLGEAGKKRAMTEFEPTQVAARWARVLRDKL